MSETRNGRRTSARIADKDEAPSINGLGKTSQTRENTAEKPAKHNRPTTANDVAKGGRGKRKQDYDEESDGFVFTRTRAKKTKVAEAPKEQPIPEAQEEPALAPPKKPRRRSRVSAGVVAEGKPEVPKKAGRPPRRSARNSGGSTNDDPPPLEVKKKRTRKSDLDEDESRGRSKPGQDDRENVTLQIAKSSEISKIALPFADTPIIRRNKAMRAESGQRRSSLGNRGRRASSLIDSGRSSALPHPDVQDSEFYKHIESDIPEPRRMRQLLSWCGTRAMKERPTFDPRAPQDYHERSAAREIQQQLLKDFSAKSELSDWFNRPEAPQPQPQALRPNPLNVANLAQIEKLEKQIARLQSERKQWEALLAPKPTPSDPPLVNLETPHPHTNIDASLFTNPTQQSALQTLRSFLPSQTPASSQSSHLESMPDTTLLSSSVTTRLDRIASTLEFSVDTLNSNAHTLSRYRNTAEQAADHILGVSAHALELRDAEGGTREAEQAAADGAGTGSRTGIKDVLRGLSRVLGQGKS